MNLPRFSVHHPVFASMVTLIVVLLGLVSLSRLRTDLLPEIELPTLSVRTDYEGADPVVVERLVTRIVEEIVATVPGVEEIESTSSEGASRVRVTFAWGTDIDTAAVDVRATVEDEINELPDDIQSPRVSKFDVNSFPVVLLGVVSDMDPVKLTDLIENQLRFRFSKIPGVAQVDLWGGFDREMRVEMDPDRLNALAIPLDQVRDAIRAANLDLPAGKIERGRYEISIRAPAEFTSPEDIRDTVVALRDGAAVTVGDIARIHDTHEKETRIIRVNGGPGIRVAIRKQSDANTVEVARGILAERDRQRLRLLNLIALPGHPATLRPTTPVDLPDLNPGPPEPWIDDALTQRPDLREARLRREQNRLELVHTRNGLLPRLDFFAYLAKTGFGEDLDRAQSEFSGDTYEWSAGLRLLHELGRDAPAARDRIARLDMEQADLAIHNLELEAETEVRLALVDLDRARSQVEAGRVTLRLRQATLQAERERFELGDATALDVAQAQRDLLESQIDHLRARVQTRLALIDLHIAGGLYLSRRGIETLPPEQ